MKNRMREVVMAVFRHGRALALVALLAAVGIAGASVAIAGESEEFDQAASAADLEEARGVVYGVSTGPWVISGEWILDCDDACADADLDDIRFDLAHVMVRPTGGSSHSHIYSGFSATSVTVAGDNLTIEGRITGSGPVGDADIMIELVGVAGGNATFFFKLDQDTPPPAHVVGRIGGVIVESEDEDEDEDDDEEDDDDD